MEDKRKLRINKIVSLIDSNNNIIDVGTDHGFVPIFALEHNKAKKILAIDINEKPLENAKKNIQNKNLEKKVIFKINDGLTDIDLSEWNEIIIAGMGGNSIIRILEKAKRLNNTLILHPTNNEFELRKKLFKLGYKIIFEEIVFENRKFNLVIKAKKSKVPFIYYPLILSKKNIYLGPKLKKDKSIFTHNYYKNKIEHYSNIYLKSQNEDFYKMAKIFEKGLEWKEKKL